MESPTTLPPSRQNSVIHDHHHQFPRPGQQISNECSSNQGIPTTATITTCAIATSATPTEPLLPPEWITSPQDTAAPLRSFVGFMHRQISGLIGGRNGNEGTEVEEDHDQATYGGGESLRLSRAGLLQPRSYNAPSVIPSSYTSAHSFGLPPPQNRPPNTPRPPPLLRHGSSTAQSALPDIASLHPHSPKSIRAATLQLSSVNMNMAPPSSIPNHDPILYSAPPTALHSESASQSNQDFIFPRLALESPHENHVERTPRLMDAKPLPEASDASFPLDLRMESEEGSQSRISLLTTATESESSGRKQASKSSTMTDSIGTLLSLAPSNSVSDAQETSQSSQNQNVETKNRRKQKKLSGLSLSKPSSSGSGSGSGSSDSSRSSSADSRPPQSSKMGPSRTPSIQRSGNLEDGTPTATPLATPKAILYNVPLPAERLVERQGVSRSGEETVPGHPRVRWLSPLRGVRDVGVPFDGPTNERTPLLGAVPGYQPSSDVGAMYTNGLGRQPDLRGRVNIDEESGIIGGNAGDQRIKAPSVTSLALKRLRFSKAELRQRIKKEVTQVPVYSGMAVKAIPAVLLGCLLNILDGVSYGMIVFPAAGVFADLGPMGVSMFFVSAIVAQLVYTFGGSGFAGANGSMMIEVVPFFHILATSIADQIGEDDPVAVIATTLVAYAFSSILTGLCFFLLGALKLGVIVGFFPRHILVGCIGGVGVFLIETGLTVSMRISDDDFDYSFTTLKFMFEPHNLILWALPLSLAVLLRLITHKFHHQLIFPLYFLMIPLIFYIVVWGAGLELANLRQSGWIFDMGITAQEPWYNFYTYLDFGKVHFSALWSTLPTQFALLFFNILHPPLNVPALAVSLNEDVDTNKELVAHGYSNLLSGLVGSVPNYLVYVNTLLFYRVGGDNRIAGFLLAVATAILLVIGPGPIAYLPVMVVGALIYVLGIDLVKEALWDNRHRVSWSEYITITSIMITMTLWDFVIGVLFGIVVSCFFFVIQNSQRRSIRAIYTGDLAMSAVRRPSLQRAYIREVSKQTTILRLQGFLFFGTITHVEETIRSLIEGPDWYQHPVQFLVLDLSLVAGVDMSSAEALVRIQRLLFARCVTLVFCGFSVECPVGKALESVDVLGAPGVELFSTFSDAMEWTENAYLRAWIKSQKLETSFMVVPGRQDADIRYNQLVGSLAHSPRRSHIRDVGERTIAAEIISSLQPDPTEEPLFTLRKVFSSYGDVDALLFQPITNYMERVTAPTGAFLWRQGDLPNGLFIIESGVLRASYAFANPTQQFDESMVAGTLAGELSALADAPRNATVVVEQGPAVLWRLEGDKLKKMQLEEPELARVFIQLVLKAAQLDYDILLSAVASRQ